MNILFLIFHGLSSTSGISKKILYQIDGLKANGHRVLLCNYEIREDGHRVRMIDDAILQDYGKSILAPIRKRTEYNAVVHFALQNGIDWVYIRSFHNANPFTIRMIRRLKKKGIPCVMEIPTYPYDQEYITPFMKLELFVDKCFRKSLGRQLQKIVTFSPSPTIFGVPTIRISNGINFGDIPVKTHLNDTSRELHLLGVAEIHYWHAYDRLIKGMAGYYAGQPEYKVYFHLVGNFSGPREEEDILPLIRMHGLEPYVVFHGALYGDSLTSLFQQCDLGIGSLGRHRSGITDIKTLKNREYAARGIPFIYSETDEDFEQMPYILKISPDESPVSIPHLIRFYRSVSWTPVQIRNSIQNLSWTKQMEKVIRELD